MAYNRLEGGWPRTVDGVSAMLAAQMNREFQFPQLWENPASSQGEVVVAHWTYPEGSENDEEGASDQVHVVLAIVHDDRDNPESYAYAIPRLSSVEVAEAYTEGEPFTRLRDLQRRSRSDYSPRPMNFSDSANTNRSLGELTDLLHKNKNGYKAPTQESGEEEQSTYSDADYYHERKGKLGRKLLLGAAVASLAVIGAGTIPFIAAPLAGAYAMRQMGQLSALKQKYAKLSGAHKGGMRGFFGMGEKMAMGGMSGGLSWRALGGLFGSSGGLLAAPAAVVGYGGYRLMRRLAYARAQRMRAYYEMQEQLEQKLTEQIMANGHDANTIEHNPVKTEPLDADKLIRENYAWAGNFKEQESGLLVPADTRRAR